MKLPRFACFALLLGLTPLTGYMKDAASPAPAPDEVVFRPTDKEYPREPQVVMGKRAPQEFDVVPLRVETLADIAQIYADFSRKEVRVPRELARRTEGIARTGSVQARYLVAFYDSDLRNAGIDIVPLSPGVVVFQAGRSLQERMEAQRPKNATPGQVAAAAAAVSTDQFWRLIDAAKGAGRSDGFQAAALLEEALAKLPPEAILGFQLRLNERMAEMHRWDLWAVAYIVNGGASDDGFVYFCGWVVSQGRQYYEAALKDPVRAADNAGQDYNNENEEILSVAMEAYRAKTNQFPPHLPFPSASEPAGKRWKEADLPKLYPELAKRFR